MPAKAIKKASNRRLFSFAGLATADGQPAPLLRLLGFAVPLMLLLANVVLWFSAAAQMGGPEVLVRRADFVSNLTGATLIHEGKGPQLYDLAAQHEAQVQIFAPYISLGPNDLLPYNHLPFEALAVSPLIGLPYPVIFLIWSLGMALALASALWLMSRTLPVAGQAGLMLVLAACSYQPVIRSFVLGQNSPLVLLGLCGLFAALKRDREGWAGAALLLVALKPQILPVILLVVLLQKHWKALAMFVGLLAALCVAAMAILGPGWPVDYAKLLLGVANWGNTGAIDPGIMANWRGLATHLFGWAPTLVTPVFVVLAALSVGALVWVWYRGRNAASWNSDLFWALGGVVALLTSLHLNPHDLTLLIFPAWILASWALSERVGAEERMRWLALLWAGYAVGMVGAPLPLVLFNVAVMCVAAYLLARSLVVSRQSVARATAG